jgi:hypothetical protein
VGIAPFGVSNLVEAVRPEASKAAETRLMCHWMMFPVCCPR